MGKKTIIDLKPARYAVEAVRYAAYALSGEAYAVLSHGPAGAVRVVLEPKPGAAAGGLKSGFMRELEAEVLRSAVESANTGLREFVIRRALSGADAPPAQEDSGLTPEQEKELDALIAEAERDIKAAAGTRSGDPLAITKTWEEKYETEPGRRKNARQK